MKPNQHSRTADAAAAARASHFLYDTSLVFSDPYAMKLTSPGWRIVGKSRLLHWLVGRKIFAELRPVEGQILTRARYAEEKLDQALQRGIDQYVMIGAGLDSFAWRRQDLRRRLQIFELDHPATQRIKRARLARAGLAIPENLHFAAVDFERDSLEDALSKAPYQREARAFFSWLGVTAYLTDRAVYSTLKALASFAARGSQLVLDYRVPNQHLSPEDLRLLKKLRRFTARRGEKLISSFDPATFPRSIAALGYHVLEDLGPDEIEARYFGGRKDGLRALPGCHYLHAEITC